MWQVIRLVVLLALLIGCGSEPESDWGTIPEDQIDWLIEVPDPEAHIKLAGKVQFNCKCECE
jgi:hypothetical protein